LRWQEPLRDVRKQKSPGSLGKPGLSGSLARRLGTLWDSILAEGVVHIMGCRPYESSFFRDPKLAIPPKIPPGQTVWHP
jgi:hypothetical protein